MSVLFKLGDLNANGGQAVFPPMQTTYKRVHHVEPSLPDEALPPLELLPKYKGWMIAHDEQYILEDVTPAMLDWFWANIEKCYVLWAPGDHRWMRWEKAPCEVGLVGAVSVGTSQMMPGGEIGGVKCTKMDMDSYPFTTCLNHCVVEKSEIGTQIVDGECQNSGMVAYYTAQWSASDKGCLWRSTVVVEPQNLSITDLWDEDKHTGKAPPAPNMSAMPNMPGANGGPMAVHGPDPQAAHGIYEVAMFSQFLPDLYRLWKVVDDPGVNIYWDLNVVKDKSGEWAYKSENGPVK